MIDLKIEYADGSVKTIRCLNQAEVDHFLNEKGMAVLIKSGAAKTSSIDLGAKRAEALTYLSDFNLEKYDPADAGEIFNALIIALGVK